MDKENYFRHCNSYLAWNLSAALFVIGFSCILMQASKVLPVCWVLAALGQIGYFVLKRKTTPFSEEEKKLHQSFLSVYTVLGFLLILALACLLCRMELYSVDLSDVQDNREMWGSVLQSFWCVFIAINITGGFFLTWLEKQFYRLKFEK